MMCDGVFRQMGLRPLSLSGPSPPVAVGRQRVSPGAGRGSSDGSRACRVTGVQVTGVECLVAEVS